MENQGLRCIVCTLPAGRCVHTRDWLLQTLPPEFNFEAESGDDVQREIDDLLGVINTKDINAALTSTPQLIDPDSFVWNSFTPRASDRIGDSDLVLSAPTTRGWHSSVTVNIKHGVHEIVSPVVVIFGGFRLLSGAAPQPFIAGLSTDLNATSEYLNDVCMYDIHDCSWHRPQKMDSQDWPAPRYGKIIRVVSYFRVNFNT